MKTLVCIAAIAAFSFAQAKEVGRAITSNMQLRVFDERGTCPEGAHRVELHIDGAKRFDGCSVAHNGNLYVLWEDGDRDVVPLKMIKPGA